MAYVPAHILDPSDTQQPVLAHLGLGPMSSAAGPAAFPRLQGCATSLPKCFLIIHNISKRHNVGTLTRSATAFGVTQVQALPFVNLSCALPGSS